MSEDAPAANPRAFAPSAKAVSTRLSRQKRMLYVGAPLVAICAVTWIVSPGRKPPEAAHLSPPRASPSDYDPPKATPVAAAATVQPAIVAQQVRPQPPAMKQLTKADEPRLASFSSGVAPIPDYMKPKTANGGAPASGGIAYKATTFEGAKSFTIADQSLVLPPQPITCIMDTMVITGASGDAPFECHLEHDVLSPTSVVLMEAGTQVLGYYKSIVSQGQNRIVAITAHARTPNGVVVPLGGPVADELGAAGVQGAVDNHWGERLGGALLLSLIDNGVSLGQSALSKQGSTSINLGSGGGAGSLSQQVLSQTINIPPTITLPQGTRVQLWVTKFIDFSGSYRLETH
jgi:type IV secretion system protein VirB10